MTTGTTQHIGRGGRSLWAAPALLCAAVSLSACGDISRFQTPGPTLSSPAKPSRTVAQTPASEREHERILASYGGVYDDPRLEALISKTVDRLVAVSDRPEQAYRVTILNSGAVNAFALPTGQLYVTRGLVALAKTRLTMASFSRAQEFEADGIGVGISAKAQFDPYGASRFLSAMERNAACLAWSSRLAACFASTCAISWLRTDDSSEVSLASAISPRVT